MATYGSHKPVLEVRILLPHLTQKYYPVPEGSALSSSSSRVIVFLSPYAPLAQWIEQSPLSVFWSLLCGTLRRLSIKVTIYIA